MILKFWRHTKTTFLVEKEYLPAAMAVKKYFCHGAHEQWSESRKIQKGTNGI